MDTFTNELPGPEPEPEPGLLSFHSEREILRLRFKNLKNLGPAPELSRPAGRSDSP